jgi:hypothetical protein
MRWALATLLASMLAGAMGQAPSPVGPRFAAVDIYIDSGEKPLGAYQVELKATGDVRAVGIEGGESAAFREPPYYDPVALHENQLRERVVLAAFNTGKDLPTGRTRVARVHVRIGGGGGDGEPRYEARVESAGTRDGSRIGVKLEVIAAKDAAAGDGR